MIINPHFNQNPQNNQMFECSPSHFTPCSVIVWTLWLLIIAGSLSHFSIYWTCWKSHNIQLFQRIDVYYYIFRVIFIKYDDVLQALKVRMIPNDPGLNHLDHVCIRTLGYKHEYKVRAKLHQSPSQYSCLTELLHCFCLWRAGVWGSLHGDQRPVRPQRGAGVHRTGQVSSRRLVPTRGQTAGVVFKIQDSRFKRVYCQMHNKYSSSRWQWNSWVSGQLLQQCNIKINNV